MLEMLHTLCCEKGLTAPGATHAHNLQALSMWAIVSPLKPNARARMQIDSHA